MLVGFSGMSDVERWKMSSRGSLPCQRGDRIAGTEKGKLLAGDNHTQIFRFSWIGHNQGETAVRIFYRQMPQTGHIGLAGDSPAVPLHMQRKVAQRVVLTAPPQVPIILEGYQARTVIGSKVRLALADQAPGST